MPLSVSGFWSGSMYRTHIALQELQAVVMMLQKLISVIKVVQYFLFFPDWLARY